MARKEESVIRATPGAQGYKILDSPQDDGSRIKDPDRAWAEIETTLRRQLGACDEQVAAVRAIHDTAEEGQFIELVPGLSIKKGSVGKFALPFTEPLVEDLCLLSVAYLFLSVLVQGAIYDQAFDPIRKGLQADSTGGSWSVESFLVRSRPHEPWHGLAIDQTLPYVVVQVRLFGHHAWTVTFARISFRRDLLPARLYHLDLETGEEEFLK